MSIRTGLLSLLGLLVSFNAAGASLDIGTYLSHADKGRVYPSSKQIEMIKSMIPEHPFQVAQPISDRDFWDDIAASKSGKAWLSQALAVLNKAPEVPISDKRYRQANETGDRELYKPQYYDTISRLEHFILAECLENKGRFLPQINVYMCAIMEMKSWLHPNHDVGCEVLDGKQIWVDLGARRFGMDLALAKVLLADRLPKALQEKIAAELDRRIIQPYLKSCRGADDLNTWIKGNSNWNAVCTSGAVFVTLTISQNADERLAAVGSALNSMAYYLAGFGSDGYCSEGIGYWGYGFGHYLFLAQSISDYTTGQINLFDFEHPEKMKKIAQYPLRFHIQNGVYPAFSDSGIDPSDAFGNFCKAMAVKYYDAQWPFETLHRQANEQLTQWSALQETDPGTEPILPGVSYFDDFGVVISRGRQTVPFSIAIKAGHNAENHNHSDVGSYSLVLGRDLMAGDIGNPVYIAGAFSPNNKARSSWGHPVPRVDGQLQSNGRSYDGRILETEFTDARDGVVMDIKTAYDVPSLEKLTRTVENDKSGTGTITIKDEFKAAEAIAFGTAMMTYAAYKIVDSDTILLTTDNQKVIAEITSTGASVTIAAEPVPVRLPGNRTAFRIGIDFTKPVQEGTITVRYRPYTPGQSDRD